MGAQGVISLVRRTIAWLSVRAIQQLLSPVWHCVHQLGCSLDDHKASQRARGASTPWLYLHFSEELGRIDKLNLLEELTGILTRVSWDGGEEAVQRGGGVLWWSFKLGISYTNAVLLPCRAGVALRKSYHLSQFLFTVQSRHTFTAVGAPGADSGEDISKVVY